MPHHATPRRSETTHPRLLRRRSFWFTLTAGLGILFVAVWLALLVTPGVPVTAFGQQWSVGAQPPSFSISGQAQMTELGVPVPLQPTTAYGPVRMTADAGLFDLQVDGMGDSWNHDGGKLAGGWFTYLWHLMGIFVGIVVIAWLVVLKYFRRELLPPSRRRTLIVAALASILTFAGCEAAGTAGLASVTTAVNMGAIFGTEPIHVPTTPSAKHEDTMSEGAVLGESVAAHVGGINARWPCWRSDDSLAYWLSQFTGYTWRNLACSGATIPDGLTGPQTVGHGKHTVTLPAQVEELSNITNLKQVVVVIGPNDLGWSFQMGLCLLTNSCSNHLTETDFELRLSRFTINYARLLDRLSKLPTQPKVAVALQYDLMSPSATSERLHCLDASSLTPAEIQLMRDYNQRLNQVLIEGAKHYHDPIATPHLNELCPASPGSLDIEHIYDQHGHISRLAAHPTPAGERKITRAVLEVLPG